MIIALRNGERYKVAKPSAFAPTPMLAYESSTDVLSFLGIYLNDGKKECSLVNVGMTDIAWVS